MAKTNLSMLINQLLSKTSQGINVMHLCRVVSYSKAAQTATVQPLALKRNGKKRSLIQDALILNHCMDTIGKGKVVCVVFADRDIDNLHGAKDFTLSSSRMHSLNDAVIVGVYG